MTAKPPITSNTKKPQNHGAESVTIIANICLESNQTQINLSKYTSTICDV